MKEYKNKMLVRPVLVNMEKIGYARHYRELAVLLDKKGIMVDAITSIVMDDNEYRIEVQY